VNEASKFKCSKFFETKGGMIPNLPKYMHAKEKQGYPIKILRQDNAKENIAAIKLARGEDEVRLQGRVHCTKDPSPKFGCQN
jgi:hypothetical protein